MHNFPATHDDDDNSAKGGRQTQQSAQGKRKVRKVSRAEKCGPFAPESHSFIYLSSIYVTPTKFIDIKAHTYISK